MTTDTHTEKEEMIAAETQSAFSPEIMRCRELMYDYNSTRPSEGQKRDEMLRSIFGRFGTNSFIKAPLLCDYGFNVYWGNNSSANYNLVLLDLSPIYVGDNVLIGPDVKLYTAIHPTDPQGRLDGLEYSKPITIGNNVWIGGGTTVLSGVTIGDNSVIGAGSVVVKDIPANVVAAGNPCKVTKQLTGLNPDK